MHSMSRRAAAQAVPVRSATTAFICPSCAVTSSIPRAPKTKTKPQQQRHFSTSPFRRNTASTTDSLPPAPPPAGFARLTSRSLISIAGVDAAKFLQGIVTRNTLSLAQTNFQGFYTGFLNATGRVLHDVFIYPDTIGAGVNSDQKSQPSDAFIIEVDTAQRDILLKHLKRYKLRSKFKIAPVEEDECAVYHAWGAPTISPLPSSSSTPHIALPDPRVPDLGTRILTSAWSHSQLSETLQSQHDLSETSDTSYQIHRYLHGVPEGQAEIPYESSLPLEANMDLMNGIDFRKGCYVGQELTIRTKHRGVVRKRVLPCLLYPATDGGSRDVGGHEEQLVYQPTVGGAGAGAGAGADAGSAGSGVVTAQDLPSGLHITRSDKKSRPAGTWLRGVGNIGLALVRLPMMTDVVVPGETEGSRPYKAGQEFVLKTESEGAAAEPTVKIKAFVPPWLRQKLDEAHAASEARHAPREVADGNDV